MSCDKPVALFVRESIIVRDSVGSCGHVCFPLAKSPKWTLLWLFNDCLTVCLSSFCIS